MSLNGSMDYQESGPSGQCVAGQEGSGSGRQLKLVWEGSLWWPEKAALEGNKAVSGSGVAI